MSPKNGTSPQDFRSDTEPFLENRTRNTPIQCLNDSQKRQPEIKETNTDMTVNYSGVDNLPLAKFIVSLIEVKLVQDETTIELNMLHISPQTEKRNAACPSGFREWFYNGRPS